MGGMTPTPRNPGDGDTCTSCGRSLRGFNYATSASQVGLSVCSRACELQMEHAATIAYNISHAGTGMPRPKAVPDA